MNRFRALLVALCASATLYAAHKDKNKVKAPTPLERYVADATGRSAAASDATPGSLWSSRARYLDVASDLRASRVDDIVTIIVNEQASAVVSGAVKTNRTSSVQAGITGLAGVTRAAGPWANLANTSNQTQLDGSGTTSRATQLSTNLSARVVAVLPNGNLVIEGVKNVAVNSENQLVTVRGVIRPVDVGTSNTIGSDQIAQLEVFVNGKGAVGDAIRRPFILYRLLLGLLPF